MTIRALVVTIVRCWVAEVLPGLRASGVPEEGVRHMLAYHVREALSNPAAVLAIQQWRNRLRPSSTGDRMRTKWVITYKNGTTSTVEAPNATQAARAGEVQASLRGTTAASLRRVDGGR